MTRYVAAAHLEGGRYLSNHEWLGNEVSDPEEPGRMSDPSGRVSRPERRLATERRHTPRRAGAERRRSARRLGRRRQVESERREEERRRLQRRGVFDRRSRIGRRFVDRSRDLPSAFNAHETDEIRRMIARSSFEIECPRCNSLLPVSDAIDTERPVWEISCRSCNCAATITATSAATILIAADDAMMRDALSLVLSKAGHRVHEAETGAAALRAYRTQVPDVVIVDVSLSDMDGIDLMRRLLRFDDQARVIVIAGPRRHGTPDPLALAKRLGATDILRKPFPPDEMLTAVGEVLRH